MVLRHHVGVESPPALSLVPAQGGDARLTGVSVLHVSRGTRCWMNERNQTVRSKDPEHSQLTEARRSRTKPLVGLSSSDRRTEINEAEILINLTPSLLGGGRGASRKS